MDSELSFDISDDDQPEKYYKKDYPSVDYSLETPKKPAKGSYRTQPYQTQPDQPNTKDKPKKGEKKVHWRNISHHINPCSNRHLRTDKFGTTDN